MEIVETVGRCARALAAPWRDCERDEDQRQGSMRNFYSSLASA